MFFYLGSSGQALNAGDSFDFYMSHTLTLGCSGPNGSVTASTSGQFDNFSPTLAETAVPEPGSLLLLLGGPGGNAPPGLIAVTRNPVHNPGARGCRRGRGGMTDEAGGEARAWDAVAEWYHAFFTAVILAAVTRRSHRDAADLVFAVFRRQQLALFLPGLAKLGLDAKPHAVACAQYHYLSNAIGGVSVEWSGESDRKSWVRYPPPRWIWHGTAIAAVPGEVSRAMLRGWHGHNGVALGNPRLGFVCTGQTVEGDPGLEGYYLEHDRDLAPEERVRFARHEMAPRFDPAAAPVLASDAWPAARIKKAKRNYALAYVRTAIPAAIQLWGAAEAVALLSLTGRLIGMQLYCATAEALPSADFAGFMVALARAQGDAAEVVAPGVVRQTSWTLMRGVADVHPAAFACWNGLLEGALAAHDRFAELQVTARLDLGDPCFEWRVVPRRMAAAIGG